MKFMKIGTRPDTFYTEEAVRTLISDVPSDLSIHINNISFLLHKFALVARCGLLQRLCSETAESESSSSSGIELHDIPGGEEAFELCAKFCYGITVDLGAHNVVAALCAAKFLRMTESVEKGNLVLKLEAFFNSCVLDGWKDSILALHSTLRLPDWSHNLGIVRKCIDSIVEKILTHPHKVNWSYTYTRPGYKKKTDPVPKDWWTEDVSDLEVDMFRSVITAVRAVNVLPPQLIGEALHVYASRWLPDARSSATAASSDATRRTLEAVVGMIPADRGSVSAGFLLRLLAGAGAGGVSHATRSELLRKCAAQLDDAAVEDLVFPGSGGGSAYNVDLVTEVVENFMTTCRRQAAAPEGGRVVAALRKVGRLVDRYLQVVARDVNMTVSKFVTLAECVVPDLGRETHDDLYKAINIFLKSHTELNKAEKKRLCRILDCQKLSPEVRAHAVKNERLPLRTVVQLLFFEQERGNATAMMTRLSLHPPTKPPEDKCSTTGGDRPAAAATAGSETGESWRAAPRRSDRSGEIEEFAASKLDVRMMSRKGSRGRDR